jgi:hypothetical protein
MPEHGGDRCLWVAVVVDGVEQGAMDLFDGIVHRTVEATQPETPRVEPYLMTFFLSLHSLRVGLAVTPRRCRL